MSWGVFWQGEPEFAADQLGFYMEDLVLEVVSGLANHWSQSD